MSQNDPKAYVDTESGSQLVTRLNNSAGDFLSLHKGNARPSYAEAGTLWLDDNTPSATVWTLFLFDGTDDIKIGEFDTTNNIFTPVLTRGSDAQGDILYHNGTKYVRLAAGTSGKLLQTKGSAYCRRDQEPPNRPEIGPRGTPVVPTSKLPPGRSS